MSQQLKLKKKTYSQSSIETAVRMVRANQMSLRKAARSYGLPKSTLSDKVNGRSPINPSSRTVLNEVEEQRLVQWTIDMAKIGYGRTKQELLYTVKLIMDRDGRDNPFRDNKPGKDWYYGFLKRHPELTARTSMQLSKERAIICPERVIGWFDEFRKYMAEEIQDDTIFKDPSRWYNADESGFPLCPKSGKVLALRGQTNVYTFSASDKTQITVLASMNAAGHYVKPMIVFPGQRFSYNPLEGFSEAAFGRSENGWMDTELFTTWLRDIFLPEINERGVRKPIVLFVDGHSTHLSLEVSTICRENGIILYCLLAHASHLMQPCDLKLFSSLKESWKQSVREFQMEHIGETVTKPVFASVFKRAWERSANIENAVKGFRDGGLFPLDESKVLNTVKMEPSKIFFSPSRSQSSETVSNEVTVSSQQQTPSQVVSGQQSTVSQVVSGQPSTTNQVASVSSQPSTTTQVVPVSSQQSTTSHAASVSSQPSTTSEVMSVSSQPSTTSQVVSVSSQQSAISQFVPSQSSTTFQVVSVSSQPSTTSQVVSVSSQQSAISQFVPVSSQPSTTSQFVPVSTQPSTTSQFVSSQPSTSQVVSSQLSTTSHLALVSSQQSDTSQVLSASSPVTISHDSGENDENKENQPKQLASSIQSPQPGTSKHKTSMAFNSVLKLPSVQRKIKTNRAPLPKAISGDQFRQILLEKKQKKEAEEVAKQQRKQEREEKKREKDMEKLRKKEERETKKRQREQEKIERELSKKAKKSKRQRKDSSSDSEPENNIDLVLSDSDDDNTADISQDMCFRCDKQYDNDLENWIGCNNCPRWFHRTCVWSVDLLSVDEKEIDDFYFECDYC